MKKVKNTRRVRVPAQQLVSLVRESDQRLHAAHHFRAEAARHKEELRRLKFKAKAAAAGCVALFLVALVAWALS
jgi:hypothetical protein